MSQAKAPTNLCFSSTEKLLKFIFGLFFCLTMLCIVSKIQKERPYGYGLKKGLFWLKYGFYLTTILYPKFFIFLKISSLLDFFLGNIFNFVFIFFITKDKSFLLALELFLLDQTDFTSSS